MAVNKFIVSVSHERYTRAGEAYATITVEVDEGRVRATELNMRARKGGSFDPEGLPVVDVMMRALSVAEAPATPATRRVAAGTTDTAPAAPSPLRPWRPAATGGRRRKQAAGSHRHWPGMPENAGAR